MITIVISIIENIPELQGGMRKYVMDKKYTISIVETDDGYIMISYAPKKDPVKLRLLAAF